MLMFQGAQGAGLCLVLLLAVTLSGCSTCDLPGRDCIGSVGARYFVQTAVDVQPPTVTAGNTSVLTVSIYDHNESGPTSNFTVTVEVPTGLALQADARWEGVAEHRATLEREFPIKAERQGEFEIIVNFHIGGAASEAYDRNITLQVMDHST